MTQNEPLDIPRALAEIRGRSGEDFSDVRHLRAALFDVVDTDLRAGEVRLVLDAVELGALERMTALLAAGARPGLAIDEAGGGLARARASDAPGARWACAALAYALGILGDAEVLRYHRAWLGGPEAEDPGRAEVPEERPEVPPDRATTHPPPDHRPPPPPPPLPPTVPGQAGGPVPPLPPRDELGTQGPRSRRRWLVLAPVATAGLVLALVVVLVMLRVRDGAEDPGGGANPDLEVASGDGQVTILGPFGGVEAEGFAAALADFEVESGIDVRYESALDFTSLIKQRVSAGDAPDIALFPQPGGLLDLAADGQVQPLDTHLDIDALERTLVPGLLESAQLDGQYYGAPMRVANKSLVWYPRRAWERSGYRVPATLDELYALADQIRSDGAAPWCMGWGADAATGWVGTDWIEVLVLVLRGPDYYNEWIQHEIPFDDSGVVGAFDEFAKVAIADGQAFGGAGNISTTPVAESMLPAFRDPPRCLLDRQGSFQVSFLPTDVQANLDEEVGVFPFPPVEDSGDAGPVVGGADLAGLFTEDADAVEVMEFIASDEFGGEWARAGGWLSPHRTFDASNYPNETTKQIAELTTSASELVYDASDVMPPEVGSGTFWTGMVEWLGGKSSVDTAADIESSWPP